MSQPDPAVYACEEVRDVLKLHPDLFADNFRRLSVRDQLEQQAQTILEGHRRGDTTIVTHVKCWHPKLVGHSAEQIMSHEFTIEDARETIASEYGFDGWADAEARGAEQPNAEFEAAVDALLRGDLDALREMLEANPSLVRARSDFGHRATLLHYVGSNGVETYRQVVPQNLADVAQLVIDAGADVNATAEMYGGDCATLGLLISSGHPGEAGVMDDVVKVLLDAGAETDDS